MTSWDDLPDEMRRLALDRSTADRLAGGLIPPDDAPPGYAEVARVIRSIAARPDPAELRRLEDDVRAFAAVVASERPAHDVGSARRRSRMRPVVRTAKIAAIVVAGTLALTTGAAMAGALPGAAQGVAHDVLSKLGITVPGTNEHAGTHPDTRGTSSDTKGSTISDIARTTTSTGVDKGAEVSSAASGAKSHAGEQGGGAVSSSASNGKSQAGQHAAPAAAGSAPVLMPNGGGTGTADTASGGASSQGTGTADTASNGASSAGSGNASTHPSH
jgi:hypothetical protein